MFSAYFDLFFLAHHDSSLWLANNNTQKTAQKCMDFNKYLGFKKHNIHLNNAIPVSSMIVY